MKYKQYLPNSEEYHLVHYLILFVGLVVFLLCFSFFRYFPQFQLIIALLGSMYYIVWGVLHHALEGRLVRVVVFEYVLFGLVAFLLMMLVLSI